jgi:transcriptional regulator with XRE-family HTH domain
MDTTLTPGALVKTWRTDAGRTQAQLAKLADIAIGPLKMIETERRKLSPVEAERIAKALKIKSARPLLAAIERAERAALYTPDRANTNLNTVPLAYLVMGPNDRPRAPGSWDFSAAVHARVDGPLDAGMLPFPIADLLPAFTVADGVARIGSRPAIRYVDGRPTVIYGERRCWAALVLGAHSIACDVHDVDDADAMRMHYMENVARQDFPPLADAAELARFAAMGLAPDAIASRVGRTTEHVLRRLTLLRAIEPVREAVARGPVEGGCTLEVGEFFGKHDPARQAHAWPRAVALVGLRQEPVRLNAEVRKLLASLPLASAPWPLGGWSERMPPCFGCPKRSDAQQTIPGVEPVGAECLDPACYEAKDAAWSARKREAEKPAAPVLNDCPECEYERAHGEPGPCDRHTCDPDAAEIAGMTYDEVDAELRAEGVDVEAFTDRIKTSVNEARAAAPDPRIAEVRAVLESPPDAKALAAWVFAIAGSDAIDMLSTAAGEPVTWLDAGPRAPALLAALLAAIALDRGGAPAKAVRAWLNPPAPEVKCTCRKPPGVRGRHKDGCAKRKPTASATPEHNHMSEVLLPDTCPACADMVGAK